MVGVTKKLRAAIAAGSAILGVDGFKKFFIGGPAVNLDFEFLRDAG
jgi:hypothetical protein